MSESKLFIEIKGSSQYIKKKIIKELLKDKELLAQTNNIIKEKEMKTLQNNDENINDWQYHLSLPLYC